MTTRLVCWIALMLGVIAAPPLAAAPTPQTPETSVNYRVLQERPDRLIVELPNRLIVIAQEVPTTPVVSVQSWTKTGSIYEQEHVGKGLSHFLEHLLSGGTTDSTTEAQSNALLGKMGAQTNAATSLDSVRYYINTTSTHTATAVERMSDWMQHSLITDTEFARERDVIQREFDMGQGDPGRILWKLTQQARYETHPARHPTIGYLDDFLTITRDEIYDFYKRMYAPNNMLFVVVGDIDKQKVVDQVANLWQDAEPRPAPVVELPQEPEISEPKTVTGRADIERPRLRLAWPGTQMGAANDYELDLLSAVLGQGETSRLVRSVRDEQRLVTSIDAYNLSFHWGEGFFGIDAELAPGVSVDQVKQAVLAEVEKLRSEPATDVELDRVKRQVKSQIIQRNQTVEGIASQLASYTLATGDPDYLQRYSEAVQAITPEQLQASAKAVLDDNQLITITLMPLEEGQTVSKLDRPETKASQDYPTKEVDLDNAKLVSAMEKNLAAEQGEAKAVEVESPQLMVLPNGLRLIVQRSTVVPAVSMQLFWKGGLLADEPGQEGVANATAEMLMRGAGNMTGDEISQTIESLGAGMSTSAGNNTTYISASALKEDFPQVLQIMSTVLLEPTFPEQEWAKLQPRLLAAIDRQDDSWSGELFGRFIGTYFDGATWQTRPIGRAEVVQQLTVDEMARFHKAHLGASDAVMAIVGDVDVDAVRSQVEQLFGAMPEAPAKPFVIPQMPHPQPGVMQFPTGKPLAAAAIGIGPGLERSNSDYPAMTVLSRMISDFPSGWLQQALRGEGPGLVYAANGWNQTGLAPGYFAIMFNTSPAQAPLALERSMAVVDRARTGEITEADLDRARAKVLTGEFFSKQSNSSRAMDLALDELYGVGDPTGREFLAAVEAMDADTLRAVAQRYLKQPVAVVITNEPIDEAALQSAVTGAAPAEATAPTP